MNLFMVPVESSTSAHLQLIRDQRPGGHQGTRDQETRRAPETRDQEGTRGPETMRPEGHQETRDQETRRAPGDQRPGDQEGHQETEPRDQHLPPLYTLGHYFVSVALVLCLHGCRVALVPGHISPINISTQDATRN
ncbi:unnamed protein product [Arctogadus glacialis]